MEEPHSETLYLSKLESYQDFLRNPENMKKRRGVYVWGFRFFDPSKKVTTEFIPYYVGKHRTDIHQRIQEHVDGIREGTHKVIRKDLLERFPEKYRSQKPEDHIFINDKNKSRRKDDLSAAERVELIPHIHAYIDNFYVTYVDISILGMQKDEEKSYIDYLERYVQDKVGTERISSRLGIKYPATFCPQIMMSEGIEGLFHT